VPLATVNNAPILLTQTTTVPAGTLSQIRALGAKNIVLLGGTGVISNTVQTSLTNAGYTVSRLSGADRYSTATAVGGQVEAKTHSTTAVLATGSGYADALSIGPVAGIKGWPVVFTSPNALPSATASFLTANKIKNVVIVGGTGVVSQGVENAVKAMGISTSRVAGADRYATSAAIANAYKTTFTSGNVSVATGMNFADALTGGVLSAYCKMPLFLLDPKNGANVAEQSYVKSLSHPTTYIYGGAGALSDAIVATLYK